jgi:cobalt-zinc-cadmium efflux system outer membrane protein
VRVTQLVELGAKRAKRVALARSERDLAAWDYEARRVDLAADVSARYVAVVQAQEEIELRKQAVSVQEAMHKIVEDRVAAGGLLPIHKDQSLVRLELARIDLNEAQVKLQAARRRLASAWGGKEPKFKRVTGTLEPPTGAAASLESLEAHLEDHPLVARTVALLAHRQADLELARANAVPDLEVGAGARYFRDNDDYAFLVELSVPLPLFDRNQGEILSKRFGLAKSRAEADQALALARDTLISAHRDLTIAHRRAAALAADVLPRLESLLQITRTQFDQGLVKLDDMLDAHRDLLRARVDQLNALAAYHGAAAIIEGLISRPLAATQASPSAPHESRIPKD